MSEYDLSSTSLSSAHRTRVLIFLMTVQQNFGPSRSLVSGCADKSSLHEKFYVWNTTGCVTINPQETEVFDRHYYFTGCNTTENIENHRGYSVWALILSGDCPRCAEDFGGNLPGFTSYSMTTKSMLRPLRRYTKAFNKIGHLQPCSYVKTTSIVYPTHL